MVQGVPSLLVTSPQDTKTAQAAAAAVAEVEEKQLKLMQAAGQFSGQLDRMEMLERWVICTCDMLVCKQCQGDPAPLLQNIAMLTCTDIIVLPCFVICHTGPGPLLHSRPLSVLPPMWMTRSFHHGAQ
jgi:hypothetical protein